MSNLLVVDWDMFFPNPMEAGEATPEVFLYDWGHKEAPFFQDHIWGSRAHGFLANGLPLPAIDEHASQSFWDRFSFTKGVKTFYADSNSRAANPIVTGRNRRWESVWLYDAHHDTGYTKTPTAAELLHKGMWGCDNWMVLYRGFGADLHVRYPQWRSAAMELEPEPLVSVDRQVDDGTSPDVIFDRVFICRSSAWVPPWNDHDAKFEDFVAVAPGNKTCLDGEMARRHFDMGYEQEQAELMNMLRNLPGKWGIAKGAGALS